MESTNVDLLNLNPHTTKPSKHLKQLSTESNHICRTGDVFWQATSWRCRTFVCLWRWSVMTRFMWCISSATHALSENMRMLWDFVGTCGRWRLWGILPKWIILNVIISPVILISIRMPSFPKVLGSFDFLNSSMLNLRESGIMFPVIWEFCPLPQHDRAMFLLG